MYVFSARPFENHLCERLPCLKIINNNNNNNAVCLRHAILTRKSRSRRLSEYEILEKSRPHDNFLKNKNIWFCPGVYPAHFLKAEA
jgi:hypothetical protein